MVSICYSQNPDGKLNFKIKNDGKEIIFIINKSDSTFYDNSNKYVMKVSGCLGEKCKYKAYDSNLITHSFQPNPDSSYMYLKDSTQLDLDYMFISKVKIGITRINRNKEKMIVYFSNIGQIKFSTEITFKKGNYFVDVRKVFKEKGEIIKKGYSYPYIETRYFEKIQ